MVDGADEDRKGGLADEDDGPGPEGEDEACRRFREAFLRGDIVIEDDDGDYG